MASLPAAVAARVKEALNVQPTPAQQALQEEVASEHEVSDMAGRQSSIQGELMAETDEYSDAPPKDELEFKHGLIRPTVIDDPYHDTLTKELSISNVDDEELDIQEDGWELVSDFISYGMTDLANRYHTRMMRRLMLARSKDMAQQNVWQKRDIQTRKLITVGENKQAV